MAAKTIVSLDIGFSSVKIAQFEAVDSEMKLVGFGVASYPREQVGVASDDAILNTLRRLMDETKIRPKAVYLSIPRAQLTSKRLSDFPPNASQEQITDMVSLRAETELPFGGSQVVYDYQVLQSDANQTVVELVGARREVVDRYIDLVSALDIHVEGVIPSTDALGCLATSTLANGGTDQSPAGARQLVISVGAAHTDLIMLRAKRVVFSRSFPTAGDRLTQAYADALELDFAGAEQHKREYSLLDAEMPQPVQQWADTFVREIKLSIQAAAQESIGEMANQPLKIWMCGGTSLAPGLVSYVETKLGETSEDAPTVVLWDPLEAIHDETAPEPAVAQSLPLVLGTGLLAASGEAYSNLLPFEIKEQRSREQQQRRVLVYAAAALVLLLAMVWAASSWVSSKVNARQDVETELANKQPRYRAVEEQLKTDLVMAEMLGSTLSPLDVLQELSDKLPPRKNIALKSFTLSGLDQAGKALLDMQLEANSHADISKALNTLKNSPMFGSVKSGQVTATEKDKRPIFQVQLKCKLAPGASAWVAKSKRLAAREQLQLAALPPLQSSEPEEAGDDFMPMDEMGFMPLLLDDEPIEDASELAEPEAGELIEPETMDPPAPGVETTEFSEVTEIIEHADIEPAAEVHTEEADHGVITHSVDHDAVSEIQVEKEGP